MGSESDRQRDGSSGSEQQRASRGVSTSPSAAGHLSRHQQEPSSAVVVSGSHPDRRRSSPSSGKPRPGLLRGRSTGSDGGIEDQALKGKGREKSKRSPAGRSPAPIRETELELEGAMAHILQRRSFGCAGNRPRRSGFRDVQAPCAPAASASADSSDAQHICVSSSMIGAPATPSPSLPSWIPPSFTSPTLTTWAAPRPRT